MRSLRGLLPLLLLALLASTAPPALAVYVQDGPKIVPDDLAPWTFYGEAVALSSDGQTALAGANGLVRVLVREPGARWTRQATLSAPFGTGSASLGTGIALSADGATVVAGGTYLEDGATRGAVWTFTRTDGAWTMDGAPLSPADATPVQGGTPGFGESVALSADGRTLLVGGTSGAAGAAWVFARQQGRWTQQGTRLTADLPSVTTFGTTVALSGDGGTALIGTWEPDAGVRADWVFRRSGARWSQDGPRLVPDDGTVAGGVALDADGTSAMVTGFAAENGFLPVMWSFRRGGSGWAQDGSRIAAPAGETLGTSVALTPDGNVAVAGSNQGLIGSAWVFRHDGAGWRVEAQLVPNDAVRNLTPDPSVLFGWSVALSPDAGTVLVGGPWDNSIGAVWTFRPAAAPLTLPRLRAFAGTVAPRGALPAGTLLDRGNGPTGTITYSLYAADAFCGGPPLQTATVPVNGNGVYATRTLTADALGFYSVSAAYGGDARNAPASTSCDDMQFQTVDGAHLAVETRGSREARRAAHARARARRRHRAIGRGDDLRLRSVGPALREGAAADPHRDGARRSRAGDHLRAVCNRAAHGDGVLRRRRPEPGR